MSDSTITDEKLEGLLMHFAERLNLVFSYFFCTLEFLNDDDAHDDTGKNDRAWALQTIQNACLYSSLLAIRDLNDFFDSRPKRMPNDLRAGDFGYGGDHRFLAKSERDNIDQLIVHTTIPGASRKQYFRWQIWELTAKCVPQCISFLMWIPQRYLSGYFLTWTAAHSCKDRTQAIYNHIAQEIEKYKASDGTASG